MTTLTLNLFVKGNNRNESYSFPDYTHYVFFGSIVDPKLTNKQWIVLVWNVIGLLTDHIFDTCFITKFPLTLYEVVYKRRLSLKICDSNRIRFFSRWIVYAYNSILVFGWTLYLTSWRKYTRNVHEVAV